MCIIRSEKFGITPMIPASFISIIGINRSFEFILFSIFISMFCSLPNIAYREFKYNRKNFYNIVNMFFFLLLQFYSLSIKNNIMFWISAILALYFLYKFVKSFTQKEPNQVNYTPVVPYFAFATLLIMLGKTFSG